MQKPFVAPVTQEQEFHHAFRLFADALDILALPAEAQCGLMGDFCVPTKLKADIQAGEHLVGRGYLSRLDEVALLALVRAMDAVPIGDLPCAPGRDINLQAMRHACWDPIRRRAEETRRVLRSFSASNGAYLMSRLRGGLPA